MEKTRLYKITYSHSVENGTDEKYILSGIEILKEHVDSTKLEKYVTIVTLNEPTDRLISGLDKKIQDIFIVYIDDFVNMNFISFTKNGKLYIFFASKISLVYISRMILDIPIKIENKEVKLRDPLLSFLIQSRSDELTETVKSCSGFLNVQVYFDRYSSYYRYFLVKDFRQKSEASPTSAIQIEASQTSASQTSASPTSASPTSASQTGASPTSASPTGASQTSVMTQIKKSDKNDEYIHLLMDTCAKLFKLYYQ